jgi:hypothetical protein
MALASNVHCEVRVRDIPTGVELDVPVSDLNGITVPRRADSRSKVRTRSPNHDDPATSAGHSNSGFFTDSAM